MWRVGRYGFSALCLMYDGTLPSHTRFVSITRLENSDSSQDVGLRVSLVELGP
jgi:hypothetical protein